MLRTAWLGTFVLAMVLALVGCEAKKDDAGKKEEKAPAAKEGAEAPTEGDKAAEPDKAPEEPAAPEEPKEPEVKLAEVSPVEIPADWAKYEKVEDIPEDQFGDIMTKNENDRPSVFTLKADAAFQSYPCQAGERISVYVNGDAIAGCTLGVDFTVAEGLHLAKGTEIKTQPSGDFTGFVLKQPQDVLNVPVKEGQTVYWTKSSGLGGVTLAKDAQILGIDFKAGTQVYFRSNTAMKSLQQATLKGDHNIGGTDYKDGQKLEFDKENKVTQSQ